MMGMGLMSSKTGLSKLGMLACKTTCMEVATRTMCTKFNSAVAVQRSRPGVVDVEVVDGGGSLSVNRLDDDWRGERPVTALPVYGNSRLAQAAPSDLYARVQMKSDFRTAAVPMQHSTHAQAIHAHLHAEEVIVHVLDRMELNNELLCSTTLI